MAIFLLATACRKQEPAELSPRHVAVLSEDQITSPLTLAIVEDELHVLFANLDTLTLQLVQLDPHRNRHTLETIDLVGIYPADLTWFGVHAYAVYNGRQHVIYLDQQQADALIPKWIYRDAGEDQWWVTSPTFEGTPRALLSQDASRLLLVTSTTDGASVVELLRKSGPGRHQQERMGDHPRVVRPLPCTGKTSFVALSPDGTVQWHRVDGSIQPLLRDVGAYYAACVNDTAHILWHMPSTSEVLFARLTGDGIGPTTAVTLTIGTTSVYFFPYRDGFSFVIDEFSPAHAGSARRDAGHRIALIHPDKEQEQGGYRKSVLVKGADPRGFSAAHLDDLLIIVERRSGEPQSVSLGLRASIYSLL